MYHLLRVLRPVGVRRGRRRPGWPGLTPHGARRARRGNWVIGEPGPAAEALAVDLLTGLDPRDEFAVKRYRIGSLADARRVLKADNEQPDELAERRHQRKGGMS